jgi:hypothetical protein
MMKSTISYNTIKKNKTLGQFLSEEEPEEKKE